MESVRKEQSFLCHPVYISENGYQRWNVLLSLADFFSGENYEELPIIHKIALKLIFLNAQKWIISKLKLVDLVYEKINRRFIISSWLRNNS